MEQRMRTPAIAAVIAALTFAPTAFAQTTSATPANQADCEKAKMKRDDKGGKDGKGCLHGGNAGQGRDA
jgi:hypothetical protein